MRADFIYERSCITKALDACATNVPTGDLTAVLFCSSHNLARWRMQKAPDLSLTVKAECEQRGVPWETMARQDTGPAVEYSFPEDLKFTVEV